MVLTCGVTAAKEMFPAFWSQSPTKAAGATASFFASASKTTFYAFARVHALFQPACGVSRGDS
jgi:hypothetical protein